MGVKKLAQNRLDLLYELVKTNFKMRYYNSFLGVLWVLIRPYSTFIVFYLLWSNTNLGRANGVSNYSLYLLLGIVLYTFANEMIIYGQAALLDRANIILKVNFPRQIAVIAALSNAVINFFINIVFVVGILFLNRIPITLTGVFVLAAVLAIIFLWGLGIAFFSSVISIRFRDLKNILELGMFLLMYATPIFYEPTSLLGASTVSKLISANPLGILINQVRAGLGVYAEVNIPLIFAYLVGGVIFSLVGALYFEKAVKSVAEHF